MSVSIRCFDVDIMFHYVYWIDGHDRGKFSLNVTDFMDQNMSFSGDLEWQHDQFSFIFIFLKFIVYPVLSSYFKYI